MTQSGVVKETRRRRQREAPHPGRAESLVLAGGGTSTDLLPSLGTVMTPPGPGSLWVCRFAGSPLVMRRDLG